MYSRKKKSSHEDNVNNNQKLCYYPLPKFTLTQTYMICITFPQLSRSYKEPKELVSMRNVWEKLIIQ